MLGEIFDLIALAEERARGACFGFLQRAVDAIAHCRYFGFADLGGIPWASWTTSQPLKEHRVELAARDPRQCVRALRGSVPATEVEDQVVWCQPDLRGHSRMNHRVFPLTCCLHAAAGRAILEAAGAQARALESAEVF